MREKKKKSFLQLCKFSEKFKNKVRAFLGARYRLTIDKKER